MTETTTRKRRNSERAPAEAQAPAERGNLRAQGMRTRESIITAARNLLLEGGSLEFTLREVATRAGISISNLQYYFPTRLAVLRAVFEPTIEAYLIDLQRALDSKAPPRAAIVALIERALREAKSTNTPLWWHFISLAAIDTECSRLLDEWYEAVTRGIAQLIRAENPACTAADSLHRATLIIAMADGVTLQVGAGRRKRDYTRGLDAKFMTAVDCLLRMETPLAR